VKKMAGRGEGNSGPGGKPAKRKKRARRAKKEQPGVSGRNRLSRRVLGGKGTI